MQEADLKAVHDLVQTTIQVSYGDVYPPEAINFFKHHHSKENILQDIERGYIVVAESDSRIVGTGTLVGNSVRRVFINPEYQRRGIGHLIAKELEQKAIAEGLGKIELSSSLKSRKFWESEGFAFVKEFALPVANDKHLIYFEMAKKLE
jgi:GNAT superfamily N-acetyltransferase